jgi:hypothetical protein
MRKCGFRVGPGGSAAPAFGATQGPESDTLSLRPGERVRETPRDWLTVIAGEPGELLLDVTHRRMDRGAEPGAGPLLGLYLLAVVPGGSMAR